MYESIFDNATNVEPIETIEDIEVLDTNTPIEPVVNKVEEIKPVEVVTPVLKTKEKDNIFAIQIILIIAWVLLTTIVYFFGYPLFEPFINV